MVCKFFSGKIFDCFFTLKSKKTVNFQINIPNSFVVADEIEIGFGNIIPLWLFGLLY